MRRSVPTWLISGATLAAGIAVAASPKAAQAQDFGSFDTPPPPPDNDGSGWAEPLAAETQPPPAPPDQRTFDRSLSPYGHWVDTPEYGRVWIPDGVPTDWQPYTDGQWVDTPYGWAFASYVPWGWATFHYGYWGWGVGFGWYWVPGYVWAPAWVGWRYYGGYACWSPMPPHGYVYHGHWPGWVVMPQQHFTHPIKSYAVPKMQAVSIARAARPVRGFASARAGTWSGSGSRVTGRPNGSGVRSPSGTSGNGSAHSFKSTTSRTGGYHPTARPTGGFHYYPARSDSPFRSSAPRYGSGFGSSGAARDSGTYGGGFHTYGGGFHAPPTSGGFHAAPPAGGGFHGGGGGGFHAGGRH